MQSLDSPFDGDTIELWFDLAPVSVQSPGVIKANFKSAVREKLANPEYLLCGDVSLNVEWLVSERSRYESDRTPDVDNILKPLIDALTGPAALLIDDNQIQHVSCSWIDSTENIERLRVEIRFFPGEYLPKRGLVFVQFERGLCFPVPFYDPPEVRLLWTDAYKSALQARNRLEQLGIGPEGAKYVMPVQRVFHRTRLSAFTVVGEDAFRQTNAVKG